ncbi:MAG: FlgD immunoglobulin-like domain containing protein [Candidatus Delongbacteria bacterium]
MNRACLLALSVSLGLAASAPAAWRHVVDYTYATGLVEAHGLLATSSTRGAALFDPAGGTWRHLSLPQGLLAVSLADVCQDGAGTLFWAGRDASLSARSVQGEVESRGFLEFREHPLISSINDLWGGDGGVLVSHSIGVTRFEFLPESDEFLVRWNLHDLGSFSSQSAVLAAAPLGSRLVAVVEEGLAVGEGYPALPASFTTRPTPAALTLVERAWLAPGAERIYALLRGSQNRGWLGSLGATGDWTAERTDLESPLALAAADTRWAVAVAEGSGSRVLFGDGREVLLPQQAGALTFSGDTLWATLLPDTRPGGLAAIVDGALAGSWSPDVPGAEQFMDLDFTADGELWAVGVSADLVRNGLFQLTETGWRPWQLGYSVFANYPTSVCCDSRGGVWFGSWGKGCSRLLPADSSLVTFNADSLAAKRLAGYQSTLGGSSETFCLVSDVEEDAAGNLWIINHQAIDDSCLVVLPAGWYSDSSTALQRRFYAQFDQIFPYFLEPSPDGLVWAGMAGKESRDEYKRLLQLSPRGLPVTRLGEWRLEEHQLADAVWNFELEAKGSIRGLRADPDGNLWISTSDGFYMGGLYGSTAQFSRVQFIEGLLSEDLGDVEVDGRGRVWLGSAEGLNVYEPESGTFREPAVVDELNHYLRRVDDLVVNKLRVNPRTGELWAATSLGLFANAEGAQNYGTSPAGSVRMYPNPFRPDGTRRARVLPEGLANDARLSIYDANGRRLRSLSLLEAEAGWDGRDSGGEFVPSGVYLLLVTSSGGSAEGKLAVIH